jgi:hypothetical protein
MDPDWLCGSPGNYNKERKQPQRLEHNVLSFPQGVSMSGFQGWSGIMQSVKVASGGRMGSQLSIY